MRAQAGEAAPTRPAAGDRAVVMTCEGLGMQYHRRGMQVTAVESLDLVAYEGEFVVLLGPSGCGKSTMLRIFGGLQNPTWGQLDFPAFSGAPRVNMVFQGDALYPWMKAVDNVALGLRFRGISKRDRHTRALEELRRVGLDHAAHLYPKELSGGMNQRVNLARAFANDPDVLLMDEPFAALDIQTRLIMQESLLALWEANRRTVLFVTHSIEEALVLADRVLVMGRAPSRIIGQFKVPFPRPREAEELKFQPEFTHLHQEIWGLLRGEVLAAQAQDGS
jgi:NitT/TauT family transport system ATP-binding protein